MKIRISAYGDLKFYTPAKAGVVEMDLEGPELLSVILNQAGFPIEYIGTITVDKITVDTETLIAENSEIKIYPMVSGG